MVDVTVNFTLENEEPVNAEFQVQPDVTFTADIKTETSTRRHEEFINRDLPDQHPIGAITGLTDILSNKQNILTAGEGITIIDNVISSTQASAQWGNITGSLNNQTDLKNVLDSKANISDIPTVGNATLTIQKNNTTIDTFTANATVDKIINLTIPTNASDVNALPDNTKYGASISLTINSSTYVVTAQLKDQNGDNLGTAQTIDLPLESVVVNGSYDNTNKKIVLTLQNGTLIDVPVGDLVAGLQTEITSSNKLSASLVSGLATVATSGSYDDLSNKPTIPTVNNATLTIQKNSTNVATFAANASSDVTANISVPTKVSDLTNDSGFITGITSSDVITALGYTPYNSSNPSGYQANVIETVKVNGTALTPSSKAVDISVPTTTSSVTSGSTEALTSGGAYTALQSYQTTSNLVTSVSSSSTDTQYPSAKLFYDTCGDIETLISAL